MAETPGAGDTAAGPAAIIGARKGQFRAIISQIKDYAIYTIDLQSLATSWNEGVERVLGYSEAEFIGHDVGPLIFTAESLEDGVPQRELEQARVVGQSNNDRLMRRKDGSTFFATGITTAIRDASGTHVGYVKVMRDQSQWKHLQSELQQSLDTLADQDRRRIEFLAVLAHELRNPLAPIRNAAEILPRISHDEARLASVTDMIKRQVGIMSRLIDDLMDISRITHGKIELQRRTVDVSSVVQAALDSVRQFCEHAGHAVKPGLSVQTLRIHGDATRLSQIVVNLLMNACKFTPRGGQIWLSTEREGDEAVIRVKDTGVGIALEEQGRIFEMFAQADDSTERSQGGLGIGLALVQQLVELHGGSVHVHSAGKGEGSEFIVRLPLLHAAAADSGDVAPARDTAPGRRILVVDDNIDAAQSLADILELEGHIVHVAHDGLEAIRVALAEQPHAILLDIGLPGMNGFEAARRIREAQPALRPAIFALTGWGQAQDRERSAAAGIDAHLVKPVDPLTLAHLLSAL